MKDSLHRGIFPWVSLLAGVMGLALQSWLLSSADGKGLLPSVHLATLLCVLLVAVVLEVCLLTLRNASAAAYEELLLASHLSAVVTALAAVGMTVSAFTMGISGLLGLLTPIFGVLAGGALLVTAYCRFQGLRPNCLLHGVTAVFFIVRTMACCQSWGSEPQLQLYLLPLLSSLFLLIAAYYRAELDVLPKHGLRYVFFSQGAVICCLACAAHPQGLFYLSAGLWLASDFLLPLRAKPE